MWGQEDCFLASKHVTDALDLVYTGEQHAYRHTQWREGTVQTLSNTSCTESTGNFSASSKTFMPFRHAVLKDSFNALLSLQPELEITGVFFSMKTLKISS